MSMLAALFHGNYNLAVWDPHAASFKGVEESEKNNKGAISVLVMYSTVQ